MPDSLSLDSLLAEIGPRDPDIMEALRLEDDLWVVRFENVDIEIERDAETDRFVLSTDVGPVAAERQAKIYETLLVYNLLWRETGGVRMGLAEADGPVRQFVGLHASEVDAERLSLVLHNLKERTLVWRKLLEGEKQPGPPEPNHPVLLV